MKIFPVLLVTLVLVLCAAALVEVSAPALRAPAPADLLPAGPLLVLEAGNFSSLLRNWNDSPEKQLWLESDNFRVFSRSRLYLRLKEARKEFATAAGFSPQMDLLETVAGQESALALYDIGQLEFLYVTRMRMARAVETVLWQTRAEFEPRSAAGLSYFLRVDPKSGRVVAFAVTDKHLLLATREDLLARALKLLSGEGTPVKGERWFDEVVRAAGPAGDLRLVMNLKAITRTPHFRSYWIQRNVSDLRQYVAAVSDLRRSGQEIREQRVLMQPLSIQASGEAEDAPAAGSEPDLSKVLRLVPDDYGLYRAWVLPTVKETLAMLERKLLAPPTGPVTTRTTIAPRIHPSSAAFGTTNSLETRIDKKPPRLISGGFSPNVLRALLQAAELRAILQVESSRPTLSSVFIQQESVVVLLSSTDWEGESVRSALLAAIEGLWTTSRLGAGWAERGQGPHRHHQLDGLARLVVATRGPILALANSKEALAAVLERLSESDRLAAPAPLPVAGETVYAGQFRHGRERDPFLKMMGLLDHPWIQNYAPTDKNQGREPRFFSENLGSLSRTLQRLDQASIVVRDQGRTVSQTVIYRLAQ